MDTMDTEEQMHPKLVDFTKCPICARTYNVPISMNCCGQTICKVCFDKCDLCPFCRKNKGKRVNNIALIDLLKELKKISRDVGTTSEAIFPPKRVPDGPLDVKTCPFHYQPRTHYDRQNKRALCARCMILEEQQNDAIVPLELGDHLYGPSEWSIVEAEIENRVKYTERSLEIKKRVLEKREEEIHECFKKLDNFLQEKKKEVFVLWNKEKGDVLRWAKESDHETLALMGPHPLTPSEREARYEKLRGDLKEGDLFVYGKCDSPMAWEEKFSTQEEDVSRFKFLKRGTLMVPQFLNGLLDQTLTTEITFQRNFIRNIDESFFTREPRARIIDKSFFQNGKSMGNFITFPLNLHTNFYFELRGEKECVVEKIFLRFFGPETCSSQDGRNYPITLKPLFATFSSLSVKFEKHHFAFFITVNPNTLVLTITNLFVKAATAVTWKFKPPGVLTMKTQDMDLEMITIRENCFPL